MSAAPTRRAPSVAAVMLGVIVAVRIWNAVVYNLRQQHDAHVHIGYLRDLVGGHLPTTYNAPWYYGLTYVLASPVIAACRLMGTSERKLLDSAVGVSGTGLFLVFMAGCLALGRDVSAAYLGAAALRFYDPVDGDIAKWEYIVWVFVFLPLPIAQALSSLDGQRARLARAALLACAAAGCVQSVVTTAF